MNINSAWSFFNKNIDSNPEVMEGGISFSINLTDRKSNDILLIDLKSSPPTCTWSNENDPNLSLSMTSVTLKKLIQDPTIANDLFNESEELKVDVCTLDFMRQVAPELMNFIVKINSLGKDHQPKDDQCFFLDPDLEILSLTDESVLIKTTKTTEFTHNFSISDLKIVIEKVHEKTVFKGFSTSEIEILHYLLNCKGVLIEEKKAVHEEININQSNDNIDTLILSNGYLGKKIHQLLEKAEIKSKISNISLEKENNKVNTILEYSIIDQRKSALNIKDLDKINETEFRSLLKHIKRVVCTLELTTINTIIKLASIAVEYDVKFMVVTVLNNSIEVGPTLIDQSIDSFYSTRFNKNIMGNLELKSAINLCSTPQADKNLLPVIEKSINTIADYCLKKIDVLIIPKSRYRN